MADVNLRESLKLIVARTSDDALETLNIGDSEGLEFVRAAAAVQSKGYLFSNDATVIYDPSAWTLAPGGGGGGPGDLQPV